MGTEIAIKKFRGLNLFFFKLEKNPGAPTYYITYSPSIRICYHVHPNKFRGKERLNKIHYGLINVNKIDGELRNVKNVYKTILTMTNMYGKVKNIMRGLKLNFVCMLSNI